MGQYSDLVEQQRVMLKAEKWRKKIKIIEGKFFPHKKLWTTHFNDGAQLFEKLENDKWTETSVASTMSIEECIDEMGREEQDAKLRG